MVRSKTRQELAIEFGVSRVTLYRILKRKGIELPSGLITPADVLRVYASLGTPTQMIHMSKNNG
jgi:hypothetical protein